MPPPPEKHLARSGPARPLLGARVGALALLVLALAAAAQPDPRLAALSDAPDPGFTRPALADRPATYAQALAGWRSAEAVNAWLGANFTYDPGRALALSETARAAAASPPVLEPAAFFADPRGVCVDLARFAVTVLRAVDPQAQAGYLMLEFEPVRGSGQVLRRHWLATFRRDGQFYFFADSKRPGHLAGPYASVDAFVAEYGAYRGRAIVAHRVTPSHERRLRRQAPAAARSEQASAPARLE